ncbi:hypothetical protein SLEP1_g7851 [Rubroshorea leprosula]|uniref:Uncharacterized protein n=1 Tax=Rubroshorea leprosula TaxID=152421 RepID=A0AAV5I602_9ROSI|nr:hypothetical protein SLEP1_g7851 [Rubroshorea leprosula]
MKGRTRIPKFSTHIEKGFVLFWVFSFAVPQTTRRLRPCNLASCPSFPISQFWFRYVYGS